MHFAVRCGKPLSLLLILAMTMIRIECVRDAARLESMKSDFDRLSNGAEMRRLSWLMPWWDAYQATHQLHVLVAYRGESVCGILPLAEKTSAVTGRSLVFMGSGKVCSDDMGILAESVDSEELAAAFANWLVESPDCCRWDHLDLDGVREDNQTMDCFGQFIEALTGSQIERKRSPSCWAASLAGGQVTYLSRLTYRARKLFREAEAAIVSGKGTFEIAQSLEQALEFTHEIERIHQARWKEKGIDGCFSSTEFSDFLSGAIRAMWQDPWSPENIAAEAVLTSNSKRVLVGLVRINGIIAAGSICFRERDSLAMYLVGMNPEFAESRPGWMLNTCFIKHAIEIGCASCDFLRGDEEYKKRLGGVPTVQHRWVVPANRLTSQVRNVAYRTAVSVKKWWENKAPTPTQQT